MASNIEGDVIDVGLLLILGVIVIAAYAAWKGSGNLSQALANAVRSLWNMIDGIFSGLINKLTPTTGNVAGNGPDWVYTGTNQGSAAPGGSPLAILGGQY